ncbi:MAG: hypothetical protein H0V86_01135 [Chloroflexia bacterium]|nr:hypothetical protein [Chloroflexia bacterium]
MTTSKLALAAMLLTVGLGGLTLGRLLADPDVSTVGNSGRTSVPLPTTISFTSRSDVPGSDIETIPRYPGSVRVEYRRSVDQRLLKTEVEYVVTADLEPVHDFYREIFRVHRWLVADLGFSQGEWTFFLVEAEREAVIEIESRGELVEVEIELSEPHTEQVFATPRRRSVVVPTVRAKPKASATPEPTKKPQATAGLKPRPTASPAPPAKPKRKATATPEPTKRPQATARPKPRPTAAPAPPVKPKPASTATPTPTLKVQPAPTPTPKPPVPNSDEDADDAIGDDESDDRESDGAGGGDGGEGEGDDVD